MKKKYLFFTLIFLLVLSFCIPAAAVREYGVIYDETEALGSQTLAMQGEQTLPQLSEKLGIDLRVDVITESGNDSIGDTAKWIYSTYGYGCGEHKEDLTLTILLEQQEDEYTYAMSDENWCIYATLRQGRGSGRQLACEVRDAVEPFMVERAWNGEDMTMSATALTQAVDAMAEAAEDYILTNGLSEGYGEETCEAKTGTAEESTGVDMEYVFDISDLLAYEEWQQLESRAAELSKRHGCGIYFALVDDYREYGESGVFDAACQIYHNGQLGIGENRDGIIVLISMNDRDYEMFVYGEHAEYAFDEFGQEKLEERFLEDLGYDDWYGGVSNYLNACDEFLTKAEEGKPVRPSRWGRIVIATGLSFLAAGIICCTLLGSMKNVCQKTEANDYLTADGLHLTKKLDQFLRSDVIRKKIEKESSDSTRSQSGGGSGRSGKF